MEESKGQKEKLFNLHLFNKSKMVFPEMVFKTKFDCHLFMNIEDWFNNEDDYKDLQCFLEAINEPFLYCAVPEIYNCVDLKIDIKTNHKDFVNSYLQNTKNDLEIGLRISPEGFWYGQSNDWAIVSDIINNIFIVGLNKHAALNFKADFPYKYFDATTYIARTLESNEILGNKIDIEDSEVKIWINNFLKIYKN